MLVENLSIVPSLKTIESTIGLIDVKKDELKKAFDDLQFQANSLRLSSFSISWSDVDSYFTTMQNLTAQRFHFLESNESSRRRVDTVAVSGSNRCATHQLSSKRGHPSALEPLTGQDQVDSVTESVANRPLNQFASLNGEQPSSSNSARLQSDGSTLAPSNIDSVATQKEFCERRDGEGLRMVTRSLNDPVDTVPISKISRCSTHPLLSGQGDPSTPKPSIGEDQNDLVIDLLANRPLNQVVSLNGEQPSSSNSVGLQFYGSALVLKELCERMDGKGLRRYISDRVKDLEAIQMELPGVLKSAPDPGAMILNAIEDFYIEDLLSKSPKTLEVRCLRNTSVFLLEKLMETMAFLLLLATYGLGAEVDKEELVDYFVVSAGCRQTTMLCRSIGLGEKIHDLIQKLLDGGKQLLAVKFVFEFGLADKFPPVPLLEDYVKETRRAAAQVCRDGKHLGHRREPPATPTAAKPQQQEAIQQEKKKKKKKQAKEKQQNSGNKHPKTTASVSNTVASWYLAGSSSVVPPVQQSLQPAGLLPDHSALYLSPQPTSSYGMVGSTPAFVVHICL
ncbi:hypothetical protein DITRI_Ditri14bG0143600 [Diplodiscus trichospermus]